MQNNSNKKFQNIKEIIGEEKQAKIKALEEESQDILVRLKKEGIEFESLSSLIKESIKTRTNKILYNNRYPDMTEDQINILKEARKIKKDVNLLALENKKETLENIKETIYHTDSMEMSLEPWPKTLLSWLIFSIKSFIKMKCRMKKECSVIFKNIHKPLKLLNNYYQDLLHKEYHKTFIERFISAKHDFNRSLLPAKNSLSVEILKYLYIKDFVLLEPNGEKIYLEALKSETCTHQGMMIGESLNKLVRERTHFGKMMEKIEQLQQEGKRVWIIIPHPAYIGPLVPRHLLKACGFTAMQDNINVICGPRVLTNKIYKAGALSSGNLYNTVVSEQTTKIETDKLKRELQPQGVKTSRLIIGKTDKVDFEIGEKELYEKTKDGIFVVAPEGSRTIENEDGSLKLKYCASALFGAFIQKGDYIIPFSTTGTHKIQSAKKGKKMPKRDYIGVSVGEPIEVSEEMMTNKEKTMRDIMQQICDLPSLHTITMYPEKPEETKEPNTSQNT